MSAPNSHSYELGWMEGCCKAALHEIEFGRPAEAARLLRRALDETERKAAFARLQTHSGEAA